MEYIIFQVFIFVIDKEIIFIVVKLYYVWSFLLEKKYRVVDRDLNRGNRNNEV